MLCAFEKLVLCHWKCNCARLLYITDSIQLGAPTKIW